jgi:hypothetical protein
MSMEPNLETLVNIFNPLDTQNAQGAQLENTIYFNPNNFPTSPKETLTIYLIDFLTRSSYHEAYTNLWFVKQQPTYNKI